MKLKLSLSTIACFILCLFIGGPTSEVLQQAGLPVISNEECAKGHGLPIPESLICTASEAGDSGACNVFILHF